MKLICKNNIARLTSIIINPFLVHISLILIVSLESAGRTAEGVRWFFISIFISTVPIFIIVLYLVRHSRIDSLFIKVRDQRDKVYFLSSILIGIACAVLFLLRAPLILVVLFIAIFIADMVFAFVNRWWKISVHVASLTAAITVLIILYGAVAAWTVLLVPLVAWARVEMEHHSLAQVLAGGLLSSLIIVLVFLFFNLL